MTQDVDKIVSDLTQLVDMLAIRGFRLACKNWGWATRNPRTGVEGRLGHRQESRSAKYLLVP